MFRADRIKARPSFLADKEDGQISSGIGLPKRGIDIFARTMSLLSKAEVREVSKDLSDLLLLNAVLFRQFFNDILKPYEARNLQENLLLR
jgi:hypothetical protein